MLIAKKSVDGHTVTLDQTQAEEYEVLVMDDESNQVVSQNQYQMMESAMEEYLHWIDAGFV